ncbi:hypothetical protein PPL_08341 [Heterostelium album PN500]|uniref:Uncharacterized protein n=1 Tax=Heterostelium pallidum (strain ATCC 26659 / Pp 5 / PN500) TaxID=670386 RepID=D3BHX3_HETP5|nr:hypothetical protein PPL_08341 [Heterostelium album PN500]EFA78873.1 hypothetical protein PPL_08341 [Heterostelium album PN500]|eukprot:XP_020430997.1 hypothetical protein PPL_08341 [Heterostelium album PN500]
MKRQIYYLPLVKTRETIRLATSLYKHANLLDYLVQELHDYQFLAIVTHNEFQRFKLDPLPNVILVKNIGKAKLNNLKFRLLENPDIVQDNLPEIVSYFKTEAIFVCFQRIKYIILAENDEQVKALGEIQTIIKNDIQKSQIATTTVQDSSSDERDCSDGDISSNESGSNILVSLPKGPEAGVKQSNCSRSNIPVSLPKGPEAVVKQANGLGSNILVPLPKGTDAGIKRSNVIVSNILVPLPKGTDAGDKQSNGSESKIIVPLPLELENSKDRLVLVPKVPEAVKKAGVNPSKDFPWNVSIKKVPAFPDQTKLLNNITKPNTTTTTTTTTNNNNNNNSNNSNNNNNNNNNNTQVKIGLPTTEFKEYDKLAPSFQSYTELNNLHYLAVLNYLFMFPHAFSYTPHPVGIEFILFPYIFHLCKVENNRLKFPSDEITIKFIDSFNWAGPETIAYLKFFCLAKKVESMISMELRNLPTPGYIDIQYQFFSPSNFDGLLSIHDTRDALYLLI